MGGVIDQSSASVRGYPVTYPCRGWTNYVGIAFGGVFATAGLIVITLGVQQSQPIGYLLVGPVALVAGCLVIYGSCMNIRNCSITLYEDRVDWSDWRGTHRSCPNGDVRMTLQTNGRTSWWTMKTMSGESVMLTSAYPNYQEIIDELRARASNNPHDSPKNDRQRTVKAVVLFICGLANLGASAYWLSTGQIQTKGGGTVTSDQPSFAFFIAFQIIASLLMFAGGVWQLWRNASK